MGDQKIASCLCVCTMFLRVCRARRAVCGTNLGAAGRRGSRSMTCFFSTQATPGGQENVQKVASDLVEKLDYDHYMMSLFFPERSRAAYHAIRAYNVELSTIRDSVHGNELTGKMRFQFWRDALEKIYSGQAVPQHPTVLALARACRSHRIGRQWLERCLNAKEAELIGTKDGGVNMSDLEEYSEAAFSSLLYSSIDCLDVEETESINAAASHVGIALGMVTILRAIPHTVSTEQRVTIPRWVMAKSSATDEEFIEAAQVGPSALGVDSKNAIFEVSSVAHSHILAARAMLEEIPHEAKPAYLPGLIAIDYLDHLEQADFNVFDTALRSRSKRGWHTLKFLWNLRKYANKGIPLGPM